MGEEYVLDASAAFEYLMDTPAGKQIAQLIESASVIALDILDAEVLSALRSAWLRGAITADQAQAGLEELAAWEIERVGHRSLTQLAWRFRHNVTAYDALYVALAHERGATILTTDRRLSQAPGLPVPALYIRAE